MIEQCVNKFPSWFSDWRLPLVFFLFQKTRCTCLSSYFGPLWTVLARLLPFSSPAASAEDIACAPPPSRLGLCHLSAAANLLTLRRPVWLTVAAAAKRPAPRRGCWFAICLPPDSRVDKYWRRAVPLCLRRPPGFKTERGVGNKEGVQASQSALLHGPELFLRWCCHSLSSCELVRPIFNRAGADLPEGFTYTPREGPCQSNTGHQPDNSFGLCREFAARRSSFYLLLFVQLSWRLLALVLSRDNGDRPRERCCDTCGGTLCGNTPCGDTPCGDAPCGDTFFGDTPCGDTRHARFAATRDTPAKSSST